jgi:hypothetical protein
MTEKQSAILVERARVRNRLRKELRLRCAVFNETGHGTSENAPMGWCEIQRVDSIDTEGIEPFDNDEHAALAVCQLAGAAGCAMLCEIWAGLLEPVALDGCGARFERMEALNRASREIRPFGSDTDRRWIVIVPRHVAKEAGLLR